MKKKAIVALALSTLIMTSACTKSPEVKTEKISDEVTKIELNEDDAIFAELEEEIEEALKEFEETEDIETTIGDIDDSDIENFETETEIVIMDVNEEVEVDEKNIDIVEEEIVEEIIEEAKEEVVNIDELTGVWMSNDEWFLEVTNKVISIGFPSSEYISFSNIIDIERIPEGAYQLNVETEHLDMEEASTITYDTFKFKRTGKTMIFNFNGDDYELTFSGNNIDDFNSNYNPYR